MPVPWAADMMTPLRIFLPIILGVCLFAFSALAVEVAVGDAVAPISGEDQHGKQLAFTNGVRFLLVVAERACATAANVKLTEQGAGYLEKHSAIYLMDIHTMPAVGRFFALPAMRKYPYRILLIKDADTLKPFPVQPGHVTVMALTPEGRIKKISYWDPSQKPVAEYLE